MRKHIPVWLANCGAAVMGPQFDIGEFLPLWVWTGVMGALAATTLFLYSKELRAAVAWLFRSRQKRTEEVVRRVIGERENERMRRIAEVTVMHYVEDPQ